jgi:hypothetical protein
MRKLLFVFVFFALGEGNVFAQSLEGCNKALNPVIHYQLNGFGAVTGNTSKPKYNTSPV